MGYGSKASISSDHPPTVGKGCEGLVMSGTRPARNPARGWRVLRAIILERDDSKCQSRNDDGLVCGKRVRLEVHHLNHDPKDDRPENLSVRCVFHHLKEHNKRPKAERPDWGGFLNGFGVDLTPADSLATGCE